MSGHPSLVGASAGRGLRRLLAAALALGMAFALAVPARAATEVFPANGGFDGSAAGWSSSESCDGLASALLCSVDSSYAGGDGAPPGSIEFSANTVLSVNQLNTIAQDLLGGVALDDLLEGLIDPGGLLGGLLGPGLIDLEDVVGGLGLPLQLDGAGLDQLLGGLGLPVVSEGGLNDLIGLLGIVVLPVEPRGTWASPEFTYSGASPQAVTFSYDRRALIGPLVNLGGKATVQVVLVNITNGTQTVLADEELTAANGSFTPSTRGVVPNAISPGSRYRIEIRTRFSSLVSVLATSKM
ncbi:MAG: hypothetical protein K2X91_19080, partial [Thermoleophilia bacterium]|nr:hypothetical protein [Thermoleophilia bacterium]